MALAPRGRGTRLAQGAGWQGEPPEVVEVRTEVRGAVWDEDTQAAVVKEIGIVKEQFKSRDGSVVEDEQHARRLEDSSMESEQIVVGRG